MGPIQQAQQVFGVTPTNALWDELVSQFGEFVARIILSWLIQRQPQAPAGLLDNATLRRWALALIRQHKAEIMALIEQAFDAGLEALGA